MSGLWIGDVDIMYNKKFLQDNGITIIINCTINYQFNNLPTIKNIRLPLSDSLWGNIDTLKQYKHKIITFIDDSLESHNILIACYDGKTLSPFIISLYLLEYGNILKEDIKKIIQSKNMNISMEYDLSLLDL